MLLGAFLVFSIQPLFARMALPLPIGVGILIAVRPGSDLGVLDFGMVGLLLVFVPSAVALYALAERPLGFALGIAVACGAALLAGDAQSNCGTPSATARAPLARLASGSAPSPAIVGRDSAGRSTRSIRWSSASLATSAISTISPSARPMPRSVPAMLG